MSKVVKKNLKVDFHIHSAASKNKDGEKVKENTIQKTDILIKKLLENNVDMFSISDHDTFDFELYEKLKEKELDGTFRKVFPAVEFSVSFTEDIKPSNIIHIVCIFDDSDKDKLRKLNSYLGNDGKIDYDLKDSFSESKFLKILRNINIDVVMIAHQKGSVNSKTIEKNDIANVGKWRLNEFISSEFFDSFEFRNPTNGIFNNLFKKKINEKYDVVRFITGTDCHDWSVYPKMDKDDTMSDYRHTYLKCLPVFKGIAMALTDDSRISLNENSFSIDKKKIDSISIDNNGIIINLPLSHGINVIIGDNSIGKSLLLHRLNDYKKLPTNGQQIEGYKNYLKSKGINITTLIDPNDIYAFDDQGAIRKNFNSQNPGFNNEFLSTKFPSDISSEPYLNHINNELDKFYEKIHLKFKYDEERKKMRTIPIITEDIKEKHLSATVYDLSLSKQISAKNKVKTELESILSKLKSLKLTNISEAERTYVESVLVEFEKMKDKYVEEHTLLIRKKALIGFMNLGISSFNTHMRDFKSDVQNQIDNRDESIVNLSQTISELIKMRNDIKQYDYSIEEMTISNSVEKYGKYNFIKRFKNKRTKIDYTYYKDIISRTLIKDAVIDTNVITKSNLMKIISNKTEEEKLKDPLELLKNRVSRLLQDDFENESAILNKDVNVTDTLSQGLNSTMYFDIISNDKTEGIYLVDQPEDDISQSGIRESIIEDFKEMRSKRQVILVTHNPQFVVNLDVDNVICMELNDEGIIEFKSGALEYFDSETNILQLVLEHLDGGLESIRKRWKRYEKNIEII
jgi:predicted ATPase